MAGTADLRRTKVTTDFLLQKTKWIEIHRRLGSAHGEDAIDVSCSDAGPVVLRAVKRTLVTGPTASQQRVLRGRHTASHAR